MVACDLSAFHFINSNNVGSAGGALMSRSEEWFDTCVGACFLRANELYCRSGRGGHADDAGVPVGFADIAAHADAAGGAVGDGGAGDVGHCVAWRFSQPPGA